MDRQPQHSTSSKKGASERGAAAPAALIGQYGLASAGGELHGAGWSPLRVLQLQQVIGNRSVAQLLSRHNIAAQQRSARSTSTRHSPVIQRWKDGDTDETIVGEILSALESLASGLGFAVKIDKSSKLIVLSNLYSSNAHIEISIQPLSESESGQPVFVSHGTKAINTDAKPYIMYIAKSMDQQQLGPLLTTAVRQIRDWASGTPGWIDTSGQQSDGESTTKPSTLRSVCGRWRMGSSSRFKRMCRILRYGARSYHGCPICRSLTTRRRSARSLPVK